MLDRNTTWLREDVSEVSGTVCRNARSRGCAGSERRWNAPPRTAGRVRSGRVEMGLELQAAVNIRVRTKNARKMTSARFFPVALIRGMRPSLPGSNVVAGSGWQWVAPKIL